MDRITKIQKQSFDSRVLNEIAGVKNDITFPALSGVFRNLDSTILTKGGGRGIHLYDDLLRDSHASGVLQKRQLLVVAHKWEVVPASDKLRDRKIAEEVQRQLQSISFDRACMDLLLASAYGYAVAEVMWGIEDGRIVVQDVIDRDQCRFNVAEDYSIRLRTPENNFPGIPVPERKFIWHKFGSRAHNPYGRALGEAVLRWVWYRNEALRLWLEYLDKFASPTVVVTTDDSTTEFQQQAYELANSIASSSGVQVPAGLKIELLESKRNTTESMFNVLVERCNEEISKAILGESVTTSGGERSSRAAVAEYSDLSLAMARVDSDLLCETLNKSLVKWIVEFNFPGATPPKLIRKVQAPTDKFKMAQMFQYLASIGVRPTLAYITQELGGEWEEYDGTIGLGNNDNNRAVARQAAQDDKSAGASQPALEEQGSE